MHVLGAIPTLARLAVEDPSLQTRKKAILALSSGIRNYQPSLDMAAQNLPESYTSGKQIDAADMDAIDDLMQKLRDASQQKG